MTRPSLLIGLGLLLFHGSASAQSDQAHRPDSAFAALQDRGRHYMGVDQYTSTHQYEDLVDGGRIVLVRDSTDTAGVAMIRMHLQHIARAFGQGDFRIPMLVHEKDVPGIDVMARKHQLIRYGFTPRPGGGTVTISTKDPGAVKAIHSFLAFQRSGHRTDEHHTPDDSAAMAPHH